ncbi:formylglycine-generating enzyme family protein [Nocardia africana]|uniref:Serine/threonine-protein kinase pkn1 n=1 Tax=Nocardia africana TaxID=134964 RepID=A0A378WQY8_9NOCA|nr:formylglycine-generating enzyme family protein [Nocardia africana]MCC3314693.1 formylglycine-generating enzyme family protein [Nocardia africana]SUA43025.1 Serine/threonine-protein kinase pkn1 [Nocardia africana]
MPHRTDSGTHHACCAPAAGKSAESTGPGADAGRPGETDRRAEFEAALIAVPGGTFTMGDESRWAYPGDGEGPCHPVTVDAFAIGRYAVTNADFAAFVADTGYRTDAEKYGWSFVFAGLLPPDMPPTRAVVNAPWWRQVEGADWAHPFGPGSDVGALADHPVVHVSWEDARAFCAWSGTRLPTEAEWEYAARAGSTGPFPWGEDFEPGGQRQMNVFTGEFPRTAPGAHLGTMPVSAYAPNGFGLYNTTGNVWEWCSDFFSPDYYRHSPEANPTGPDLGRDRVMRGGSYLCHLSYCRRYRVSARQGSEPVSSTGNLGFRVVADIPAAR